jgi:hypothetical protein
VVPARRTSIRHWFLYTIENPPAIFVVVSCNVVSYYWTCTVTARLPAPVFVTKDKLQDHYNTHTLNRELLQAFPKYGISGVNRSH